MKRASWLVFVGVIACGPGKAPPEVKGPAAPAQGAGAQAAALAPPTLRLPGGARPLRYDVELTIDPASEDFAGSIAIELELAEATRVVWLNAEEITVESAVFDAAGAQIAARPIAEHKNFLGLVPDRPLAPGKARLAIKYRGKAHRNDGDGIYTAQEGGAWYAFTQFQATDARQAFPCFDEPSFKTPWQLTIHTKKELVALANTPIVSEAAQGGAQGAAQGGAQGAAHGAAQGAADGMKTVRFAETPPLPSYLVAFAVGPFDLVDAGKSRGGAPIRIAVPRGRGKDAGYAIASTRPVLDLLEDYFGTPYPFAKLDLVAVPVFNAGAMENPGLVTYKQDRLLMKPGEDTPSRQQGLASLTAHELAHQWFGNYVTLAWWDDIWLNEAFATWMASKVIEQWKPAWDAPVDRVAGRTFVMGQDSLDAARAIRQPIASEGDILNGFDSITYGKGLAVLTMLERWIGPETFQRGVRAYMQKHAWGSATYADFVGAMSAAAGKDLGPAFDSFVQKSGVPLVSFELRCGGAGAAPARLALTQRRYRPTGSKIDPKRTWQVPVCVRWGVGKERGRDCMLLAAEAAELPLSAKACPDWVMPNEAGAGYYRMLPKGDLLDRLLARARKELTLAERVGLVGDVNALVASGDAKTATALALLDSLSKDRSRHIVDLSIEQIAGLDAMVPPDLRPRYERLIRRLFRARAAELGWKVRGGESADDRRLRPALLALVAGTGRDPELGKQATALAWRWLDDRKAVDADLVRTVLAVAARRGDQKLFDRLLADANKAQDRDERARLLGALGAFSDPKLLTQAMTLVLGERFDLRDATELVQNVIEQPAARELAYRFVVDNFDAILRKLPPMYRPFTAYTLTVLCDDARKAEAEQFFRPRIEKLDGGPRILAQALEQLSLCAAAREAQLPGIVEYLKKQ